MDQSRQDAATQHQNVHLHMHQVVCGCHGNIYPPASAYYPPAAAVSYRPAPAPTAMVAYGQHQQMARPYLQHYQYTQYNQYSMPMPQVAAASSTAAVYAANSQQETMTFATPGRDRREKIEIQEEVVEVEKPNETSGYDHGHVSPPPTKELLNSNSEENKSENFVKFLERSCITAEQIAYRNRNRPCFRNIQNLCVRTRSEVLKPCTTVSNIHSQGIPWATKDFIYAFVRLTNCWHILRGYWENRDGPAIGKITKELTPEFRECYVRWEKETVEMAAQLSKVFYNLDMNINSPPNTGSVHAAHNLIPPQVSLLKNPDFAKSPATETVSAQAQIKTPSSKTATRGVLRILPGNAETSDQANQTCLGDFFVKSPENQECLTLDDNEEDGTKVYMKPGSYNVPKRTVANNTEGGLINMNGSPRTIEFLETAQNVGKAMEAANNNGDRYWSNGHGKRMMAKPVKEEIQTYLQPPQFNVQKWLISSRFSDYDNASSTSSSSPNVGPYYIDTPPPSSYKDVSARNEQDTMAKQSTIGRHNPGATYTLLQRDKTSINPQHHNILHASSSTNQQTVTPSAPCVNNVRNFANKKGAKTTYEEKQGGLTEIAVDVLEKIMLELKKTEFAEYLSQVKATTEDHSSISNLDWILNKLKTRQYKYVNEVVRDLYCMVNFTSIYYGNFLDMEAKIDVFVQRIQNMLETRLNNFDFSTINGLKDETVGPLKTKGGKFDGDGDHLQ